MHKLQGKKIVLASTNKGKIKELRAKLEPFQVEVLSGLDFDLPKVVEDGLSFAANAILKARSVAKETGLPALADDSGLEIAGLDNNPGIYSARFAEQDGYSKTMEKLYFAAERSGNLAADFACALALAFTPDDIEVFEGKVFGTLCWPMKGENGFGYDPFFVPDGYDKTFGELPDEVKNKISHRATAMDNFIKKCFK